MKTKSFIKDFHLIFAISKNFGIGLNNKIPWFIKEDLNYFNKITSNYKVPGNTK